MRIAIGSLFIECNHLGGVPADIDSFRRYELYFGDELLERHAGTVGGMLNVLQGNAATVVPLLSASACPSGPLTADCYNTLKGELLERLRRSLPVNGVLLALHGSAAAENAGDLEGDLLAAVRETVGEGVPIVATLDLHAHVTAQMVRAADALVAWETYPHKDAFTTGERGARLLFDMLAGRVRPAMALAKVPVLVSGVLGHTEGKGPFADVMRLAKSMESLPGVCSTSAFLVHPYLDLPEMGGGGLVITNNDPAQAAELATQIAELYWRKRFELEPPTWSAAEAIQRGLAIDGGPVLLVETADCCGGGAAGDSVASLKALLAANVNVPSLVPVVDPAAAAASHAAGVGSEITVDLGHHIDPTWGTPVRITGTVKRLSDGRFRYRGGVWDAQEGNMGSSAVLQVGPISVCIASHGTYEWSGEQYDLLGLQADQAKFVIVKNPMNYGMAYGSIMQAAYILNTPGPTPATLRGVQHRRLARPYYPADPDIPNLKPTVVMH